MRQYILVNHTPVPVEDLHEWARWFENEDRHVADDQITDPQGNAVRVSTVFLGIDHAWGVCPPLLFETMIFGGEHNEYQERFQTWDAALARHQVLVDLIRRGQPIEGEGPDGETRT